MTKKRGPFERIEKVVSKKRKVNRTEENSDESPSKQHKNVLNDHILSLYKKEASSLVESPASMNKSSSEKNEQSTSDDIVTDKQTENAAGPSTSSRKSIKLAEKKKNSGFSVKHPTTRFKDVAGLDDILEELLQTCYPIRYPKLFSALNQTKGAYVLIHGPSGCGKTHVVHALAGQTGIPLLEVQATDLVCGISGESENKIRDVFDEAVRIAPCILFIDKIHVIAPKFDQKDIKSMEKRMVTQLVASLDDFQNKGHSSNVVVIVATNKMDSIDPDLLNRFGIELIARIPDEKARLMILQVLTKPLNLPPDFDLKWIAQHTPGYVGGDLRRLVRKAFDISIKRMFNKYSNQHLDNLKCEPNSNNDDQSEGSRLDKVLTLYESEFEIPINEAVNVAYSLESFQEALKKITPSSKQGFFCMVPTVTWDDVGALRNIKEEIKESFIWPVKYRNIYEKSGFKSSQGMLLYGPKGCGKTLLAKALANECRINFLSIKGSELLNMYFGESERAVRQCFQSARNSAPCVIFFDEIDALIPSRSGSHTNQAADRVVTTLLTEMDGMEERNEVFVIGATNRIEILDSAMLRPGRLEIVIYVGLPTPDERTDILKCLTKNKTKPKISDEVDLKAISHDPRCEKFSGADLSYLVRAASSRAMRECIEKYEAACKHEAASAVTVPDEAPEVTLKHFDYAFRKVKESGGQSSSETKSCKVCTDKGTPCW